MIDIQLYDEVLKIKNINVSELQKILEWYNDTYDFKFATGIDRKISLKELIDKYEEVLVCKEEFFLGVYLSASEQLIGVIKGSINNNFKDSLWINSLIIDLPFQNNGYGTRTVKLLSEYFEKKFHIEKIYVSVVDKNIRAKNFWAKLRFAELRKINNHIVLDNEKQNVVIFEKK